MRWALLALVLVTAGPVWGQSNTICEAVAIYKEANTESMIGKRAVLDVIRFRAKVLGKTSCQVVKQQGQFSFVHKKFKWKVTQKMLDNYQEADRMGAVAGKAWYFSNFKRGKRFKFIRRIGKHYFYKRN